MVMINGMDGRWKKKGNVYVRTSPTGSCSCWEVASCCLTRATSILPLAQFYPDPLHVLHVLGSRPSPTRELSKTPYAWSNKDLAATPPQPFRPQSTTPFGWDPPWLKERTSTIKAMYSPPAGLHGTPAQQKLALQQQHQRRGYYNIIPFLGWLAVVTISLTLTDDGRIAGNQFLRPQNWNPVVRIEFAVERAAPPPAIGRRNKVKLSFGDGELVILICCFARRYRRWRSGGVGADPSQRAS